LLQVQVLGALDCLNAAPTFLSTPDFDSAYDNNGNDGISPWSLEFMAAEGAGYGKSIN
jgi:hypothetical protein